MKKAHTLNFDKLLTSQKSTTTKRIKSDYDSKQIYFIFRKCEKQTLRQYKVIPRV